MNASKTATSENIDVHDAAEVLAYCEEFGVTELELRDAIRNVGPRVEDVKAALADIVVHTQPDRYYDGMPAEEGGQIHTRETAPSPKPE